MISRSEQDLISDRLSRQHAWEMAERAQVHEEADEGGAVTRFIAHYPVAAVVAAVVIGAAAGCVLKRKLFR